MEHPIYVTKYSFSSLAKTVEGNKILRGKKPNQNKVVSKET